MASETADGQQINVPDEYCKIPFTAWLDIFLEYALAIARSGDIRSAYDTIASAFHANVFHCSRESLFLIHVCWFSAFHQATKRHSLMLVQLALWVETMKKRSVTLLVGS